MGERIRKLKKIRIHHEGTNTLVYSLLLIVAIAVLLWQFVECKYAFWAFVAVFGTVWAIVLNFYRCPIRYYNADTERTVVAPADGKVVVIEEVDENEYFHDRRVMVSIFMSLVNVHANWFPVDGKILKAWLPKASEENEHADVLIETPEGHQVLCRQIAGAMARRIVTYAKAGEECFIDEHLGFIKLGSRVDVYLPLGSGVCVEVGQSTTGDQTMIAKLPK